MDSEDDDDIAEFEKRCFGDAGNTIPDDEPGSSSEDEHIDKARALSAPQNADHWAEKVRVLESRLAEKDHKIAQLKEDLSLVNSGAQPHEDIVADLKSKLVEMAKKTRRLQVTTESQKTKIDAFEKQQASGVKPKDMESEMSKQESDDFKQKFLQSSNKLQEVRHEMQELKASLQKQKKVLLKELGTQEELDKALACADDPFSVQWQGKAAIISQLQRQLKEAKGEDKPAASSTEAPKRAQQSISAAAEQRRREFDELTARNASIEEENTQLKKQRDGYKSRSQTLEKNVKDMKGHIQTLLAKSENDDKLLAQKHPPEVDTQLKRQAKIIECLQAELRSYTHGD